MRRTLVLTDEAARHPLRVRLVPAANLRLARRRHAARTRLLGDVRDFLLAFCAFFLAALAFIA